MEEPLIISAQPWEAELETLNFDYVIVGAGAAGSVLAANLSENGKYTVCLLEAGPEDRHRFIHIPAGFTKILPNPDYVWHFGTVPTEKTAGRSVALPQGKTLGGSTSVNGMIFVRGLARDFDGWAQMGLAGWGYHARNEYIEIDSIPPRLYLASRMLIELGKRASSPAR